MYEIIFSNLAKRQLSRLPLEVKNRIGSVIERIKFRPFSFVKRLVGSKYFRLRVDNYRLILNIQKERLVVLVVEVGHRRNVYKS